MLAPRAKLWSTPVEVVDKALELLDVREGDVVCDIGCGDGRFIIECAKRHPGAEVFGIEIDEARAAEVAKKIAGEGVGDRCRVVCSNAMDADFSKVTHVYAYLVPRGYRIILPVLKKQLSRPISFVAYMSPLPAPEVPVMRVRVGTAQHPDAKWPLFLYKLKKKPSESELTAGATTTTATHENLQALQDDSTTTDGAGTIPAAVEVGSAKVDEVAEKVNAAPAGADGESHQTPGNPAEANSTAAAGTDLP